MARTQLHQSWTIKPGTTVVLSIESDDDPVTADFVRWIGQIVRVIEDRAGMEVLLASARGERWENVDGVGMVRARAALTDATKRKAS